MEKVNAMAMQGCFAGGDVSADNVGCLCDACCSLFDKSATCMTDEVHGSCERLFTDRGLRITSSNEYVALLRASNNQDLEKIKMIANLESVDDMVLLKPALSLPAKIMIVLAVLLSILIIAFIVFAILTHEGVVHIPGMSLETLDDITKWVGVGVCTAYCVYSMLALGYLMGFESEDNNKRSNSTIDHYESSLRRCADIQKRIGRSIEERKEELESCAFKLKMKIVISNNERDQRLVALREKYDSASARYTEMESKIKSVKAETADLEKYRARKSREGNFLVEENERLSRENKVLVNSMTDAYGKNT